MMTREDELIEEINALRVQCAEARRAALEEACRAMCPLCRVDYTMEATVRHEITLCVAAPIRRLMAEEAALWPREERSR